MKRLITIFVIVFIAIHFGTVNAGTFVESVFGDITKHYQKHDNMLRGYFSVSVSAPLGVEIGTGFRTLYTNNRALEFSFVVNTSTGLGHKGLGVVLYGPRISYYNRLSGNSNLFAGASYLMNYSTTTNRKNDFDLVQFSERIVIDPAMYFHVGYNHEYFYFMVDKRMATNRAIYSDFSVIREFNGGPIRTSERYAISTTWRIVLEFKFLKLWDIKRSFKR